jgi:serine/threonine-protein kinase
LGCGSFATTYLARHGGTGREVALKLLHPHRLQDPEFCRRFVREARVGARLDHPGLVAVLEAEPSWIAMEYVAGPTLAARLQEAGVMTVAEATGIALGIAEAMAYAHAHGVVHRDLKPANVILARTGPKVADLGIVRELDAAGQTTTLAFLGTPLYAAPEAQARSGSGPPADGYSLGAILFEMLDGRPPFRGETPFAILEQHRSAPVPDLRLRSGVPPELAGLVEELLAKDPDKRPKDSQVVARLKRIRAGLHPSG